MKLTHFACSGWVCLHTRCTEARTYVLMNTHAEESTWVYIQYCINTHRQAHTHTLLIMTGWGISYSYFAFLPTYFKALALISQTLVQLQKHTVCVHCAGTAHSSWTRTKGKTWTGLGTVQVLLREVKFTHTDETFSTEVWVHLYCLFAKYNGGHTAY